MASNASAVDLKYRPERFEYRNSAVPSSLKESMITEDGENSLIDWTMWVSSDVRGEKGQVRQQKRPGIRLKVAFNGGTALIASEVRKGKDILTLRNEKGVPTWSGWRHRR